MIRSLNPSRRVWPLATIRGSKPPSRSRGTSKSTARHRCATAWEWPRYGSSPTRSRPHRPSHSRDDPTAPQPALSPKQLWSSATTSGPQQISAGGMQHLLRHQTLRRQCFSMNISRYLKPPPHRQSRLAAAAAARCFWLMRPAATATVRPTPTSGHDLCHTKSPTGHAPTKPPWTPVCPTPATCWTAST